MVQRNPFAPALLIATLMATTALPINAVLALPAPGDPGISAANHPTAAEARLALSQDGFDAWRDVRGSRIAMFNGNAKLALELMTAAEKSLIAAHQVEGEAAQIVPTKTGDGERTTHWLAIDGDIVIADDFVGSPAKASHVGTANKHLAANKHKKAMEALKLAEVDVSYSRVLLPLERFEAQVKTAEKFAKEGKFFEANKALKHAEDMMRIDAIMLTSPQNQAKK